MSLESLLEWLGSALVTVPSTLWSAVTDQLVRLWFASLKRPPCPNGALEPPPAVPRLERAWSAEARRLVGAELRRRRNSEGVTAETIATIVGCDRLDVLRFERGERSGLRARHVDDYAALFGTTVTQLLLDEAA